MPESIRNLTSAIAAGDGAAFTRFYAMYFDLMYAEARRASGGRDEHFCLDIVQESMMVVIRSIKTMEDERSLAAWLRSVVHSRCFDRFRAQARRTRREHRRAGVSAAASDDLSERLRWLAEQLSNLEPEHARLLTMRFRWGWTLQRIGAALGLKTGAVDGRIARLLAALRASAPKDFDEPG